MASLVRPKITGIQYVLAFPEPILDIRFNQQLIEKFFRVFMDGQSTQTNVPDDFEPNAPRLIFTKNKQQLLVSQTQCTLAFDFKDSRLDNNDALKVAFGRINDFNALAFSAFEKSGFEHNALVVTVEQRTSVPQSEIQELIFEKFIKSPRIGPVASVEAKLGFVVDNHYVNIAASMFEERVAEFNSSDHSRMNFFRVEKMKLVGYGILYTLDVNSRLKISEGVRLEENSCKNLIEIFSTFAERDFPNFIGEKL